MFFFEKVTNTPVALYVEHKTDIITRGKDMGFGNSETGSITMIKSVESSMGKYYNLNTPVDYKISDRTVYWLKKDDVFIRASSFSKIAACFPEKAKAIKSFAKTNNLNFSNVGDMVKLVDFCNSPG